MATPSHLRLLISPSRSGAGSLIEAIERRTGARFARNAIKRGVVEAGRPDYRAFTGDSDSTLVDVETLGPGAGLETTFAIFPNDRARIATRPVFLFREPGDCWMSWHESGWDHAAFELAYVSAYRQYRRCLAAAPGAAICITFEQLQASPATTVDRVCRHWGLAPHDHGATPPGPRRRAPSEPPPAIEEWLRGSACLPIYRAAAHSTAPG